VPHRPGDDEVNRPSVAAGDSRRAGADEHIRGAVAGQEPPLSPSATGQAPARPAQSSAAPPALPFALQPRVCCRRRRGQLDEDRAEERAAP